MNEQAALPGRARVARRSRSTAEGVDPITAEIIARALDHIADEMAITMYRTARSPIVNETRDFATAVSTGQGDWWDSRWGRRS